MTHTNTPWDFERVDIEDQTYRVTAKELCADGVGFGDGWGDDSEASIFHDQHYYPMAPNIEDAKHIVHCVNLHDELVEALEFLVGDIEWQSNSMSLKYIEKTIKKAKGESND